MKQLFINGAWTPAISRQSIALINPATEEPIEELAYAGNADTIKAIEGAQSAFKAWSKATPYVRATILKKAAQLMRDRVEALATDMVRESGKPLAEARVEWQVAANLFEWYAEEGKRAYGRVIPTSRPDKRSQVIYQPLGVVGVITAWNFPAYNPARAWAAALAAGCSVVAKPAETTPLSAIHIAAILTEAGLPNGVCQLVMGDASAIGQAMLDHPALRKISFTGSTRVGKLLMDGASRTNTRLSLELGGNAPVIIFPDVDVEAVAKAAALARFRNNGQVCIAPQRFYVHQSIMEAFSAQLISSVAALKVGDGFDPSTQVGPLITRQQRDSVKTLLEATLTEGSSILTGGGFPQEKGYFMEPTVVVAIGPESCLAQREIFGPVLPLFAFNSLEEVLEMANRTEYGLAAYVFTQDLNTAIAVSEGLEFGIVGINEWTPHGTELPFGGWKQSGQGQESGSEGLYEYLEKKLISIGGLSF
jgi:acyl-CoA reductase-like NAD-dependent aldehyde dehydrogenase